MPDQKTFAAPIPDREELLEIAKKFVGMAEAGEELEVYVGAGQGTEVEIFEGQVDSLTSSASMGVGIRIIRDHRVGISYAGTLDPEAVMQCLFEARDNANYGTPDEFAGLALSDGVEAVDIDLWRPSLAEVSTEVKVNMALELEKAVKASDPRITQIPGASYADSMSQAAVATTSGIANAYRATVVNLVAQAIASDGDENQTGYGFTVGRELADLDFDAVVRDAADRCTRMLGARKPASATLPVVFDGRVTATLLAILGGTLNGESVLKGRSLFAGRVGEEIAPTFVSLADDPTNPLAFGAAGYDGEGLASRRVSLIENGVLQGYLYDSYSARRAGTVSTGSAVRGGYAGVPHPGARALMLTPGSQTQQEMMKSIGNGVLVLSISGVHSGVNTISGDFSVGAEGILIQNGEAAGAIREFTIGSTLQKMLSSVVAVGNDVEYLPSSAVAVSMAVDSMSISGN